MSAAPLPQFVSLGEALTDLITQGEEQWVSRVGGAPWNVARVMARLGVSSAFAGAVSEDTFGNALARATEAAGLDMRFLQRNAHAPLLAIVHSLHPPKYFFVGDDSADLHFDPTALPQGWMSGVRSALVGGIALARPPVAGRLAGAAEQLKAAGARIYYDPNFRIAMDARYDPMLERMARLADVIKVSDEDLCGLFRTEDQGAALARLRGFNPAAQILVTRGGEGASLLIGEQQWHARPPKITVVDTVGAGDAFIGGFMHSHMQRAALPPEEHLRWAIAAGAAACLGPGASPPTPEEVARIAAEAQVVPG
ncbi:carbohydrate kinase [Niveibacterium sp. SC-1]|uniref:carbohydrate kinase family protein n=1 Tax=Niveibacterium sp. SC-1 TaxID=3135646 RepID=UPI00311D3B4C